MWTRRRLLAVTALGAAATVLPGSALARPAGTMTLEEATIDGMRRSWYLWIPDSVPTGARAPLVMAVHGNGQDASAMYGRGGWAESLSAHGMVGLFPNVVGAGPETRDLPFLLHALEDTFERVPVDRARVYAVGFSGGGGKVYRLAAEASEELAAVAVSGARIGFEEGEAPLWSPYTHGAVPLSLLHIHGAKDTIVPIDGGTNRGMEGVSMMDGLVHWAEYLGAREVPYTSAPLVAPARVKGFRWVARPSHHEVVGLVDPKLGHAWAGWANEAILQFFARAPAR